LILLSLIQDSTGRSHCQQIASPSVVSNNAIDPHETIPSRRTVEKNKSQSITTEHALLIASRLDSSIDPYSGV
jgi:hypothetical protein